MASRETSLLGGPQPFPQTSWSLIRLSKDPHSPVYRASLETLYRKYWGPVYYYIRRNWRQDVERAKDKTQAFFVTFLEKDFLKDVHADKGRFRNFVCAALQHFLAKEKRASEAQKRSPREGLRSLDELGFEDSKFDVPARGGDDPEAQFREDWKRAIVDAALEELHRTAREAGKEAIARAFLEYDLDRPEGVKMTYEDLGAKHGLTVSQVTNGLHWARKSFKAIFRQEIESQVATAEDLAAEALELFGMKF